MRIAHNNLSYLCTVMSGAAKDLTELYAEHPHKKRLSDLLKEKEGVSRVHLKGLAGSSSALFAAALLPELHTVQLFILPDMEEAAYFFNDLETFATEVTVCFLPSSFKRHIRYGQEDASNKILRSEVLQMLSSGTRKLAVVTWPEALAEMTVSRKVLIKNSLRLRQGEEMILSLLEEELLAKGFRPVDFVTGPGEYALRGGIIDVFSYAAEYPFRIDLAGNRIDSIRTFNIETQLSVEKVQQAVLLPDVNSMTEVSEKVSVLSLLPPSATLWMRDRQLIRDMLDKINELQDLEISSAGEEEEEEQTPVALMSTEEFDSLAGRYSCVEFGMNRQEGSAETLEFNVSLQPAFRKNFDLLTERLSELAELGYRLYLLSNNPAQLERLHDILASLAPALKYNTCDKTLHEGFVDHDLLTVCFTDHQIFERYQKYRLEKNFTRRETLTIEELKALHPGDYVVHVDHGIGRFAGLEKIDNNGRQQEVIKLVYKDNDILYVSIHSLHRISKYKGKDNVPPTIHKLGGKAWKNLKQKTKSRVKDIARELIALYAKRMEKPGFAFSPDTYLQQELEASFFYEDTPDQVTATRKVKEAMETAHPMDMLICGDVGFGKTEVAIRAAFKAVSDSKQVAVLVPTTILAMQHYRTFSERLKAFPCTVDYISRLKRPAEQRETLRRLAEGKIDILIGTHRLISKDVKYKNLGLLIIDEEQKFGVAAKEKLKQMRAEVDTLTLTATPIPRTLQFSLMGARDLAIINTPPPNRHPIITELHRFHDQIIREGIEYELNRGGQVFFIHNRVDNIHKVAKKISEIVPNISIGVAHGQMEGKELEAVMLGFIGGEFDVLVATTIIESGLDIPNANTIFINNAHHFGLSDLHQLRGRVGRSNKKAFCYLLAPPLTLVTSEARRRLKALAEFSELGSGFNIALQDLDIRGAGNLLGAEQSGFIADIGFETYQRILQEAMQELKEGEFKHLYEKERQETRQYVADTQIDTDLQVMLPDDYIGSTTEKMKLYRQLNNLTEEEQLQDFEKMLEDRFGPVPAPAQALTEVVRLRHAAMQLAIERIILRQDTFLAVFVSDRNSSFYSSDLFRRILMFIQQKPLHFRLKEKNDKLTLTVPRVKSIRAALRLLQEMNDKIIE
jgi:transcription-repair coupling factor (superfamily II helicase)